MTSTFDETVAARLRGITSLADLHQRLEELARNQRTRWTRAQVFFYLPERWHAAALLYFDEENLRSADAFPPRPDPVQSSPLSDTIERAQRRFQSASGPTRTDETGDDPALERLPSAQAILDLPEPDGYGPIAQMQRALRAEIRRVIHQNPTRYRLSSGRCVRAEDGRFSYKFHWSSEPDPHAPGEMVVEGERLQARVGDADPERERCFELLVDAYLGPVVESAVFFVDPTFLLRTVHEELRERDAISAFPSQVADRLLRAPDRSAAAESALSDAVAGLNALQRRAVSIASTTDRAYVWGPPGTGKTRTVGALVGELVRQGKRVLILSPYNVAVDQAVLAAASHSPGMRGAMIRFGRVSSEVRKQALDLESRLELQAKASGLLDLSRDLVASTMASSAGQVVVPPATVRGCLDELGAWVAMSGRARRDPAVTAITALLKKLRSDFRAPEEAMLHQARVVGSTMALYFLSTKLQGQLFDHVVIDEASVVRTPEAVLAVLLGRGAPVTFFGDPRQLPAIVVEDSPLTAEWLGRSPFAMAGVSSPQHAVGACVMFEEQHRMAPPIRTLVSSLFYEHRLRDGEHAPRQGRVLVVNTATCGARSTPRMIKLSNSKENQSHRHVVAEVVRALLEKDPDSKVLVLSPFVAQKRAYKREPTTSRLTRDIRFETIHTSQGSEQDVVVIDFVLAGTGPGSRSRMLDGRRNPSLHNLLNVAISRARRQLVLVADTSHVAREYADGLLGELLRLAQANGTTVIVPKGLRCRAAVSAVL